MARRTPEQELAHQMQKMKDMGVTISVTPRTGRPSRQHATEQHPRRGRKSGRHLLRAGEQLMALVNLKNVKVYATFSKGFRVVEESTGKDGQTYKTRWTVWADAMESGPIREGDIVSLSGFLGAKVNDWEDKDHVQRHSVELSINSPRIEGATETPAVESAPADVWNTPSDDTDGIPF